jgi:hypothetical protein
MRSIHSAIVLAHLSSYSPPREESILEKVHACMYLRRVADVFSTPLDPGIEVAVLALRAAGVETFESCQGGAGHAYPEPTVRFHGQVEEGWRALAVALAAGLPVYCLRRIWPVIEKEPTGPWWELTFVSRPQWAKESNATVSA